MNLKRLKTFEGRQRIIENSYRWLLFRFYRMGIRGRVRRMRKKKCIDVLFVITELGAWKTESLYLEMKKHPRFNPILGIAKSTEDTDQFFPLKEYLQKKGYDFKNLHKVSIQRIAPDIIFYQKPYDSVYPANLIPRKHLNSLFCYANYGFFISLEKWTLNKPLHLLSWQIYCENESNAIDGRKLINLKSNNIVVTGIPMMDLLLQPKEVYKDPWKPLAGRKRIIYAPHHSIADMVLKGANTGTILENGEFMLELAKKYENSTQWIFKPHPLLKSKLAQVWGKEKTEAYYKEWDTMPHSQIKEGEYYDIFAHSDAMIHESITFRIEYLYTHKPELFLVKDDSFMMSQNGFSRAADSCIYHADYHAYDQIEKFLNNIIDGVDPMYDKRVEFVDKQLIPPHGKTACQNIINCILGQEEYA